MFSIGVMKSGAAYAPLGPALPTERFDFILSDIPIGAPIGQSRVTLIGGELCVSGSQVALGYLDHLPFGETYHTGNLAQ